MTARIPASVVAERDLMSFRLLSRRSRLALIAVLAVCCALTGVVAVAFHHATSTVPVAKPVAVRHVATVAKVAPKPVPAVVAAPVSTVTLHSGDTLWGLAQRYGTTVAALQQLNGLGTSTLIYAGTSLRVTGTPVARPLTTATSHAAVISHPTSTVSGSVQQIAAQVFGAQYGCAAAIITRESGWRVSATNPSSGAYGLAQALPGSKMATAGADWRTNPATQLTWMRGYVDSRYGGACGAWAFWQAHSWY